MTIRDKRKQLELAIKDLNSIKNKKLLNYEMTQPGSPTLKEVFTSGSPVLNDTFLLYAIKDESLDEKYRKALAFYEYAKKEYDSEIEYLAKYDEIILIEFLKNELSWEWSKIDKYLHHQPDVSRHKYKRYLNEKLEAK